MSTDTWLFYVTTIVVMMSTPGPSHLLMLSNSISSGFPRSAATAAGDLSANALQMLAAGLGLAAVLASASFALTAIKWLGVLFLIAYGLAKIRTARRQASALEMTAPASLRTLWVQGFLTSAVNPKAVVFFAALFPQFIEPTKPLCWQLAVLGATYITIDALFLLGYGVTAAWLAARLGPQAQQRLALAGGALLVLAGLALAAKAVPA